MHRNHRLIVTLIVSAVLLLALGHWTQPGVMAQQPTAEDALRSAMEQARAAGGYRVGIEVQQTVYTPMPVFGDKTAPAEQASSLKVEAQVGDANHARLSLTDGSITGREPRTDLAASNAKEMLIANGDVFERQADQWVKLNDFSSTPGLTGDGLLLLSVARDVQRLEPAQTLGGTFERVAFTLDSRDVLAFMLQQQGQLDPKTWTMLLINGLQYGGAGELWIAPTGLPERLKLDLLLQRGGRNGFNAHAVSTATYSGFGESFPATWFDPNLTPLTQTPAAPIDPQATPFASSLPGTIGLALLCAAFLAFSAFLATRSRLSRRAQTVIACSLIVAMIAPGTVYAAAPDQTLGAESQSSEPNPLNEMMLNARQLGKRQQAKIAQAGAELIEFQDEDGDTLPNGYELRLGTNPFAKDSDLDGLDDNVEILGHPCMYGVTTVNVETDPLNPDSNSDGLRDGEEFNHGVCRYTTDQPKPYAWSDDNDSDGVPDALDMSPFSKSGELGDQYNLSDEAYTTRINGANLTFEMPASNPLGAAHEMYYYEVQVRPLTAEHLQYAYKSALEWPQDDRGLIQNNIISGTSGQLQIAPFLQATVDPGDVPGLSAMTRYGISAVQQDDGSYQMILPLVPVEQGGKIYALQAKVLQDHIAVDSNVHWRDLRLKWAVQGDVLRPADDDSGQMVPSPTGNYGLVVYDEGYQITGVRVSRQAGASAIVAGMYPTATAHFDGGPIAMLRAGLESQYLSGHLSLTDVYTRFNIGNTATVTEHWGITTPFSISQPQTYAHIDEMLLNVNVTTTRGLLNSLYPSHNYTPTLVLATEQRTATLNVDELTDVDFNDLTLNLCVKELVTSRTLKLAMYQYDPSAGNVLAAATSNLPVRPTMPLGGDWTMMDLVAVLRAVNADFAALYDQAQQYYKDALTVFDMATTVWQQGQTAMIALGDLNFADAADALSDSTFYKNILNLLDKFDLLHIPTEYRQVIDFLLGALDHPGGPGAWLEEQWNMLVTFGDKVIGSFEQYFTTGLTITSESLVSFTQTAINVLTWLAAVFKLDFLGTIAKLLTRLLEIFKKVQELWNTIQVLLSKGTQIIDQVLKAVTSELSALGNNLQFIGLIFSAFATLFSVFVQLSSGRLSVLGIIGVILQAIFDIALAIVLFVVATVFPIGTVISIAIALVRLITGFLKDYFGAVGKALANILDPISAILEASNPDPKPLATALGTPQVGPVQLQAFDDAPLGGIVAGDRFGFAVTGTVTLQGESDALKRSAIWVDLGRYANSDAFMLCGQQIQQFLIDTGQLDQLLTYVNDIADNRCRMFGLHSEYDWAYFSEGQHSKSAIHTTTQIPGSTLQLPKPVRVRDYFATSTLTVYPLEPHINGAVSADVSLGGKQLWENCGIFGWDCDVWNQQVNSPPSVSYVYFDVLPRTLSQFWHWDELINRDPDGDNLTGNVDQDVPGVDNGLCGFTNTHRMLSSESGLKDQLSDHFELFDYESSPCLYDTDDDGLPDDVEFVLGTTPDKADTDEDGLRDGEEVARWVEYQTALSVPWRVAMNGAYAGLPDPAAFPNPRIGNADRDGRSDKKEKELLSSPSAFNLETMSLSISQELVFGGGTRISVGSYPWAGDQTLAQTPTLTVGLPIHFNNLVTSATVLPINPNPQLNQATPIGNLPPDSTGWTFVPLSFKRQISTSLTGLPAVIPPGSVTVTAQLSFVEAGLTHVTTESVPLLINRGGPVISVTQPVSGDIVSALSSPIRLQGTADDAEGVSTVQVCIKTVLLCAAFDWKSAVVGSPYQSGWYYDFTPPADGVYQMLVRAVDPYGVPGPVFGPLTFNVDSTPPAGGTFDVKPLQFVSTTFNIDTLAGFTVTGHLSETTGGGYVSGLDSTQVQAQHLTVSGTEYLRSDGVLPEPGRTFSTFAARFMLPATAPDGLASPSAQGLYRLELGVFDRAGNPRVNSDSTYVLIDDNPPFTFVRPPQTISTTSINLGGRADDTALNGARDLEPVYPASQTTAAADTVFTVDQVNDLQSRGHIVGDLNGDTFDDVATINYDPAKPIEVGLFFGKPNGYTATLNYTQADVRLFGELDFTGPYSWTPGVAINPPGLFDVNGDGLSDLLIGDPNVNAGKGRAYVLLGRRTWPTTINLSNGADWRISPTTTLAFGGSVASGGDLDGDGLSDVLVGAANENILFEPVYVYFGRERGGPATVSRIVGRACFVPPCGPLTMPDIAGVGDTNGDGLSDFLMASYMNAALINGRPQSDWPAAGLASANAIARLQGEGQQQRVSSVGDVNGDGLRDMLIGDPLPLTSRVFVLFGRRPENPYPLINSAVPLSATADLSFKEILGTAGYPPLGEGLTPLGDLDRDGKDDFAFGRVGAAIVLSGKTPWLRDMSPVSATLFIAGTLATDQAGGILSSGDINGDGLRDLMVGAPGTNTAFLHEAELPAMLPSGVSRVEIGVTGPITDPHLPYTATLPAVWKAATLANPNAFITPFSATITFGSEGDYRVYARSTDRAGNQLPAPAWYVGTSFVNHGAVAIPTISGTLNTPMLYREGFLRVNISGTLTSANPVQQFRTFDGERWTRQPLALAAPGAWFTETNIERSDQRQITFRSVARDAFGNVAHLAQRVTTDTLIARPEISGSLQGDVWYTNITPTLVLTWTAISDANAVTRYATIDQISNTLPINVVGANQVSRVLDVPGAWYGHVRVVDSAGNQRVVHDGPYLINRSRTPSAILPDGLLDFDGGEYAESMFATYDPYAVQKPALLLATWDASQLYLGFTGSDWTAAKRFVLYLDTKAGGSTNSLGVTLPGGEATHTLPFAADYALAISGATTQTVYSNTGAGWVISPTTANYAIIGVDTEIVLDRNSLGATAGVPVSLLAYIAIPQGVSAVLPAGARIATTHVLTGPLTFTDKIYWPSLANGYPGAVTDLPTQWIAPLVDVKPGVKTQLRPNDVTTLTIHIENPDILPYSNHLMTVTLGSAPALMNFVNLISGATCHSCPPNSRQWVLNVNVPANATKIMTLTARALTPAATGVFTAPFSATLANQGLPGAAQPPATTAYVIDNSVSKVKFGSANPIVLAPPGAFKLPLYVDLSMPFLSCKAQSVSLNKGAGFTSLGTLGAVSSVTHTLPIGYDQLWTLQVLADNGKVSTDTVGVKTDHLVPTVQVTSTLVLTKLIGMLKGLAFDDSGQLGAVKISLNGGAFKSALLGDGSVALNAPQAGAVSWELPINASNTDGEPVQIVVHAVDSAGNIGPDSDPITITLDSLGPTIYVNDPGATLKGTVTDGSGVSEVAISLDGGATYQLAALNGSNWSFNRATWTGGASIGVAVIRARDVYGNESQLVDMLDVRHMYLPLIRR